MIFHDKTSSDFLGMTLRSISDYLEDMGYEYVCVDGVNRFGECMRLSVSLKRVEE